MAIDKLGTDSTKEFASRMFSLTSTYFFYAMLFSCSWVLRLECTTQHRTLSTFHTLSTLHFQHPDRVEHFNRFITTTMTVNTFETTNKTDEEAVVVTAEPVTTSYVQQSSTPVRSSANATTAGARAIVCEAGVPRVDLGPTPVKITCGGCNHTGPSKTDGQIGTCAIVGIVVLVICFWPLFWLPLVMNDVSVTTIFE